MFSLVNKFLAAAKAAFCVFVSLALALSLTPADVLAAATPAEADDSTPALTIASAADMQVFAERVAAGETFAGLTVQLACDIDLGSWQTPIGTRTSPFCGTFDGANHTVTFTQTDSGFPAKSDDADSILRPWEGMYLGLFGFAGSGATFTSLAFTLDVGTQNSQVTAAICKTPTFTNTVSGTTCIDSGGTYYLAAGTKGAVISVQTTEPVTIVGIGVAESDKYSDISIKCVAGAHIVLQDIYILNIVAKARGAAIGASATGTCAGGSVYLEDFGQVVAAHNYAYSSTDVATAANWAYTPDKSVYLYLDKNKTYTMYDGNETYKITWQPSQ